MYECKIMPKTGSQAIQSQGLHLFWSCLWHLEFAKSVGKFVFPVYVPSLEALFASMCSTACILNENLVFLQCFRHDFAEKWDPAPGSHTPQICKANTACKTCRIHVAMMPSSWIH